MSIPANNANTQQKQAKEQSSSTSTFAETVNEAVKSMNKNEDGTWKLPDGLSEEVQVAATAEKRLRDTQATFTRSNQEIKALKAENSVLLDKAVENVTINLTKEQEEELEDLKFENPDAWRQKLNKYEQAAVGERKKQLGEDTRKVSAASLEQEELSRREAVLTSFLEANEGFEINDRIIANDIPPRITKKLENGTTTFEDFLQECYSYLTTGKVIKQEDTPNQKNLSNVGGGSKPDKNAVKEDVVLSYNSETY